jgi:hypothetical protein
MGRIKVLTDGYDRENKSCHDLSPLEQDNNTREA